MPCTQHAALPSLQQAAYWHANLQEQVPAYHSIVLREYYLRFVSPSASVAADAVHSPKVYTVRTVSLMHIHAQAQQKLTPTSKLLMLSVSACSNKRKVKCQ